MWKDKLLRFFGFHVHEWKHCSELKKFPSNLGYLCIGCGAHRVLVKGAGADNWQINGYVHITEYLD